MWNLEEILTTGSHKPIIVTAYHYLCSEAAVLHMRKLGSKGVQRLSWNDMEKVDLSQNVCPLISEISFLVIRWWSGWFMFTHAAANASTFIPFKQAPSCLLKTRKRRKFTRSWYFRLCCPFNKEESHCVIMEMLNTQLTWSQQNRQGRSPLSILYMRKLRFREVETCPRSHLIGSKGQSGNLTPGWSDFKHHLVCPTFGVLFWRDHVSGMCSWALGIFHNLGDTWREQITILAKIQMEARIWAGHGQHSWPLWGSGHSSS